MNPFPENTSSTDQEAPAPESPEAKLKLNILMVEDMAEDFELIMHELGKSGLGISSTRVETEQQLAVELKQGPSPDLVFSDHACGAFDSFGVLAQVRATFADVPFVLVTGALNERLMVKALERGVDDWVSKHRLEDLLPAVLRAIRLAEERRKRRQAEMERDRYHHELGHMRGRHALQLIVPICCVCKKIRTAEQEWIPLENYFERQHAVQFAQEFCRDCGQAFDFPESSAPA